MLGTTKWETWDGPNIHLNDLKKGKGKDFTCPQPNKVVKNIQRNGNIYVMVSTRKQRVKPGSIQKFYNMYY